MIMDSIGVMIMLLLVGRIGFRSKCVGGSERGSGSDKRKIVVTDGVMDIANYIRALVGVCRILVYVSICLSYKSGRENL